MERPQRSVFKRVLLAIVFLALVAFFSRSLWLPSFGYALVRNDGPAKADMIVMLSGDYYGRRILKAAELVRQGYAPAVLVSGSPGFFDLHECDLSIPYAVRHGYPSEWFIPFPNEGLSTKEEAAYILPELRRRKVRSCLIVTSDFHTARAARVYRAAERAAGGGPSIRFVAAPDEYFRPGAWWKTRESQKVVFFEWCKTFAYAVGL